MLTICYVDHHKECDVECINTLDLVLELLPAGEKVQLHHSHAQKKLVRCYGLL